jgi:predicted MFS family arabinose efflux permease
MDDTSQRPTLYKKKRADLDPNKRRRSLRGLDWFVFFVADVQTGFGPFIAVYLTTQKWTQIDIGFVLTVGGLISLFGQIPGGALLDAIKSPRRAAAIAVTLICISALILAIWPTYPGVLASRILHAGASCVLGPAIAALSLGLVPRSKIGERFGRNASFAAIGTGVAAAVMGFCGYYISNQAVFFVTAALGVPALISLFQIKAEEINVAQSHGGERQRLPRFRDVMHFAASHPSIFTFAFCVFLFHLANAAILPLIASSFTLRSSSTATVLIAVAMVVPQLCVALVSPFVGRKTQSVGRRPLLLFGFGALVIRITLTATTVDPISIVVIQVFDGISAAVLGVLVPLIIADLTRNTGRFNLAQGIVGCAMGLGASISTTVAGFLADRFSTYIAFIGLDVVAAVGMLTVWLAMPETRKDDD